MNKKKVFLILFLLLWFYTFPLQRICAEIKLSKFIEQKQHMETTEIISKEVWKDIIVGGYNIRIVFEGQEDRSYEYHYTFIDRTTLGWNIDYMVCYLNINGYSSYQGTLP